MAGHAQLPLYPATASERDGFILARRGPRASHDPWRHQGLVVEDERAPDGSVGRSATIFLIGRECPWRCVMCDLWQYTIAGDTPRGAIPAQIAAARARLQQQSEVIALLKLYNSGSFFDPRAVPEADYDEVAAALHGVPRVVVESHPALVGARVDRVAGLDDATRSRPKGIALSNRQGHRAVRHRRLSRSRAARLVSGAGQGSSRVGFQARGVGR